MERFRPRKRWGQNFLVDHNIARKMVSSAELSPKDIVVEIGAGKGILTGKIASQVNKVIAIEIDKKLCNFLQEELKNYENVEIIEGDFLKLDISQFLGSSSKSSVKVISNLPYYITSPIIMKLLNVKGWLEATFMLQKEVGERLIAGPGGRDYGALSILVQYHCHVEKQFNVSRNVFRPKPDVDSVVIKLELLKRPRVKVKDEKLFFEIVHAAFSQRRKKLSNSISNVLKIDKHLLEELLERLKISPIRRAETLSIEEFATISNSLVGATLCGRPKV
ncbi:16S rRNA (adenine(1518)-N(6)/adenine(1519)-N(6))-dimethyltransferase RsmA, partial [bacterium]|nr:16S rRNA (adenine(1518)-N(6)/adenine(1519)-N(6))-dimethyltransferase RsmA [bacterium]